MSPIDCKRQTRISRYLSTSDGQNQLEIRSNRDLNRFDWQFDKTQHDSSQELCDSIANLLRSFSDLIQQTGD